MTNDNPRGLPVADRRSFGPIERDEVMDRTYIPMPGGWEVQTKGEGSTFRLCEPDDSRLPISESPYLHDTLERMARDANAAHAALLAERDELRADARRLDWLDSQRGDDVQCDRNGDPELVAHYWSVYDQCYDVRTAIDAAMAAEGRE